MGVAGCGTLGAVLVAGVTVDFVASAGSASGGGERSSAGSGRGEAAGAEARLGLSVLGKLVSPTAGVGFNVAPEMLRDAGSDRNGARSASQIPTTSPVGMDCGVGWMLPAAPGTWGVPGLGRVCASVLDEDCTCAGATSVEPAGTDVLPTSAADDRDAVAATRLEGGCTSNLRPNQLELGCARELT